MRVFISSLVSCLVFLFSCSADKDSYRLMVNGENLDGFEIVLQNNTTHTSRTPELINPVSVSSNKLVFEGSLMAPCFASLKVGDLTSDRFILSNTKITLTLDPETGDLSDINGGYQQEMKEEYEKLLKEDEKRALYAELREYERDSDEYNKVLEEVRELGKNDNELNTIFIEEHPDAMMAPYALWRVYSQVGEDEAIRLFDLIDTALRHQAQYVFIEPTISAWERNPIGSVIPNLEQNDPDGKALNLHDFKGNYLLIDFWASWCSPCRAANPHMVELYNKYHDKGIEFLGVSLDKNGDDWLKAIEDDGLTWTHVSDLNYWDNEISRYFGINSIPATILIDPEGKIVAKKLHGDELDNKLVDIFKN